MSGAPTAAIPPPDQVRDRPRRPGAVECRFCGVPLTPHQTARGVCGAPGCEARVVQEAARTVFQRDWGAHVAAQRHGIERAAGGIAAAVRHLGEAPDRIAFGVVPRQDGPVVALAAARRAAFAAHLGEIVARAFAAGEPAVDLGRREAGERPEEPLLDAACATCAGQCCLLGGATHAFLSAGTMDLYRARNAQVDAPEIVAHYLSRLPEASVEHSCVYHGPRGCVLPRRERADICNRYHCNPQTDLLRRFREKPAGAAVIVAAQGEAEPAVAAFDADGWRPVPPAAAGEVPPDLVGRALAAALAQMPADLPGETDAAPAAPVCAWCGSAIDRHRAVMKQSCGRPDCERRRIAEAGEAVGRQRDAAHRARIRRMRETEAPALARLAAELGARPDEIALGVVPDGDRPLAPLAPERRAAFARHLDETIDTAFRDAPAEGGGERGGEAAADGSGGATAQGSGSDAEAESDADAESGDGAAAGDATAKDAAAPEPAVVAAACATCRGACCRGGDTRAYLSATDLRALRRREPALTPAAARARYLDRLPAETVQGSCVFHGPAGCALPRDDRSTVCNRFRCRGLDALLAALGRTGAPGALVVAAGEGDAAVRVAVIDRRAGAADETA